MDKFDTTISTYRENFDKYVENTQNEVSGEFKKWMDEFLNQLPTGGAIFEIGSASGRDSRYFASKGFKVFCTDIIPQALEKLKTEGFEVAEFDFSDKPKDEWFDKFDGFFANAVLLHAPRDVFENAIKNILTILKKDGVLAFSLKNGEGEKISTEKMDAPRYFKYYSESDIRDILKKFPLKLLTIELADKDKWLHIIAKKSNQ